MKWLFYDKCQDLIKKKKIVKDKINPIKEIEYKIAASLMELLKIHKPQQCAKCSCLFSKKHMNPWTCIECGSIETYNQVSIWDKM